jgi:hypothetical protein
MIRLAIATGAALAALAALATPAEAQQHADCAVLEIKASNDGKGVDPALRPLEKKLKRPPFSAWKSFKLLKRHAKKVARMKELNLALVSGGRMSLLYRDASSDSKSKTRLRLSLTLDDKDGKRKLDLTIKLDSGDYYLIGGDSLEDGSTYILATSCKVP